MSIIDRLVIQLGMDTKGFSGEARKSVEQLREVEKQAQATGSGMERDGVKAASFFSDVRREALAMFAVFTAGKSLKAFSVDATIANAKVSTLARQLDMDPKSLMRMEAAARAAGGSVGEIADAYGSLQKRMTDPQQAAALNRTFQMLVKDPSKSILDASGHVSTSLISDINEAISSGRTNKAVASGYLDDLGVNGQGVRNLAFMRRDKFNDIWGRAQREITPSKQELQNSEDLAQHFGLLRDQSEKLTQSLIGKLSPSVDQAVLKLLKLEQENPGVAETIAIVTTSVDTLSKSFNGLYGILASFAGISIIKRLFGGDAKAMRAAIAELKAARAGLATPKAAPAAVTGAGVLMRLLSYGGAVFEGFRLNSAINSDRTEVEDIAQAAQKGSVTNSPLFAAMSSAVAGIEHADYTQMGGASGKYAGRYQMSVDAINEAASKLGERTPSQAIFLADPAMQERYFKAYTKQNEWYLIEHNEQFRAMNDAQKLSVLAYAHNQGAAGADNWITTGVAGADQFGTSGALYATRTLDALDGQKVAPSSAGAGDTVLRYASPQSAQDEAIKRLIDTHAALKDQMAQASKAIGSNPTARMAATVTAGHSPGSTSNTTNNTTHNTNLHGDVNIQTNATDAEGIARDFHDGVRRQLAAVNAPGVQ